MKCPICGNEVANDAIFCNNCGSVVQSANQTETSNNAYTQTTNENAFVKQENVSYEQPYQNQQQNQNQQQAPFTSNVVPSSYMHIPQRNIGLCILLTIITCGIYGFYWLYKITEETNRLSGDKSAVNGGVVVIFSIITCGIYELFWLCTQGERFDTMRKNRGKEVSHYNVLYLVLGLFGLGVVAYSLMQNEINKIITEQY